MSNRTTSWLLLCGMLWLSACHKSRQSQSKAAETSAVTDSAASDLPTDWVVFNETNYRIQETDFDYLTAKAKFSFRNDKQDIDNATINFRVKKDSLIWFSVTAVGFEVARGMISSDQLVVLDKFHKEHHTYTYPELSRRFQFELSYSLLQAVLVGNLPLPRQPDERMYRVSDQEQLLLRQSAREIEVDNYVDESSHRLEGLRVVQRSSQNTLSLDYGEFKNLNGQLFPFASRMVLNASSSPNQPKVQTEIGLNHSRVDLTGTYPGFPFSVPESYKKR